MSTWSLFCRLLSLVSAAVNSQTNKNVEYYGTIYLTYAVLILPYCIWKWLFFFHTEIRNNLWYDSYFWDLVVLLLENVELWSYDAVCVSQFLTSN